MDLLQIWQPGGVRAKWNSAGGGDLALGADVAARDNVPSTAHQTSHHLSRSVIGCECEQV